jgi:hypothetical protein
LTHATGRVAIKALPGDWTLTSICIDDPLAAVRVASGLSNSLFGFGYSVSISSDLEELETTKLQAREKSLTPLFAPTVSGLSKDRAFWMKLTSENGRTFGMQAFRYDYVDSSLSDWGPTYLMGLYMRTKELLVPTFETTPANSIAERIRGKLIYHGELWIDAHARNRKLLDTFSRLGIILSILKWNPDAVWALTAEKMALHGNPTRMGYSTVEGGFLRWDWAPNDNPLKEWLLVADRAALAQMIGELKQDREIHLDQLDVSARNKSVHSLFNGLTSVI